MQRSVVVRSSKRKLLFVFLFIGSLAVQVIVFFFELIILPELPRISLYRVRPIIAVNLCPELPGDRTKLPEDSLSLFVFCEEICSFEKSELVCVPNKLSSASTEERMQEIFLNFTLHVLFLPRFWRSEPTVDLNLPITDDIVFDPVHDMYLIPPSHNINLTLAEGARRIRHGSLVKYRSSKRRSIEAAKWVDNWMGKYMEESQVASVSFGFRKSESLLLLVFTSSEQIKLVDRLWKNKEESIFSSQGQHVLLVATEEIWDSGILESVSWINYSTVHIVPRVLSSESQKGLLEILGLAFSLTLPFDFQNLITFPFNRLPLRLWTEITAVSFQQELYSSSDKWNYADSIRNEFNSSVVRAMIICEGDTCCSAAAKSIPRDILREIFISSHENTRKVIKDIVNQMSDDLSPQVFVGTFLHRVVPAQIIQNRTLQVMGFGAKEFSSDAKESLVTLFSGALVRNDAVVPLSAVDILEDNLHSWRISLWEKTLKSGSPLTAKQDLDGLEECTRHYTLSGNLGTHPNRIFNRTLYHNGEREALKARALAESSINVAQNHFNGNVLIILVSKDLDLPLLEFALVEYPKSPIFGAKVLLIPEKRSMENPAWRSRFYQLVKTKKNIETIPEDLFIQGSWGGVSLVFKELVAYYFALHKWPRLSHALILSPDTVLLLPQSTVKTGFCPGTSYVWSDTSESTRKSSAVRFHFLLWECNSVMIGLKSEVPPSFYNNTVLKGSQFKAIYRDHLSAMLLPQTEEGRQEFQKWWDFFKFTSVPDEHWIASLFHIFVAKGLLPKDLKISKDFLYTRWSGGSHPDPISLDWFDPGNQVIDSYIGTRKVTTLEMFQNILKSLSSRWESMPPNRWKSRVAKILKCTKVKFKRG